MKKLFTYRLIIFFTFLSVTFLSGACKSNSNEVENAENKEQEEKKQEEITVENTGLPSVYLTVNDGSEFSDTETWKESLLKILDSEANIEYEKTISAKGRGNSSFNMMGDKKAFSIKLNEKDSILGMEKHKRWVLVPNASDKSLVRNLYAYYLGNEVFNTEWCPSFKSVNLYYNNRYWGVYILGEQIKINKNRVNIQDISDITEDLDGDGQLTLEDGGFIIEQNMQMDEAFNFTSKKGLTISLKDPDEVEDDVKTFVQAVVQKAEDVLFDDSIYTDKEEGYAKYLDVDSFVDWYLLSEFSKNPDSASHGSIYMYYNPVDRKIHMGPFWDFDLAFGNENFADSYKAEGSFIYVDSSNSVGENGNNPWGWWGGFGGMSMNTGHIWINRLMSDPDFRQKVKNRWKVKKSQLCDSYQIVLPEMISSLEKAADYNFIKWDVLGKSVFTVGWQSYDAPGYQNRKTYKSECDYLLNWINQRYEWMNAFLE